MGDRKGWVSFNREWLDHPAITKDNDHLILWLHLICNAAYTDTPALFGGKSITLRAGQLTTGRKQLAVNSKISESKVERILNDLKSAHLIEQQASNKNRLISILSYDVHRFRGQQFEQQVNNERTTSGQRADTLEQINNITNNKYTAGKQYGGKERERDEFKDVH